MDKKIPKVFANKVDSDGNNEKVYHSTDKVLEILKNGIDSAMNKYNKKKDV